MAPSTRYGGYRTPSPKPLDGKDATTTRKCRYFDAIDQNPEKKSRREIAADVGITEGTGRNWEKQRKTLGSLARRSTKKRGQKPGPASKVTKSMCKKLVDPKHNPVRFARLEAQIQYHNLPVGRRQLTRKLKEHTNGGQIYKCAFVKKEISAKNEGERQVYGIKHESKPLIGFWDHIFFTDEAHVDPSSLFQEGVLRELGHRYDDENVVQRPPRMGVKFHVAGWVNWYGKASKLEFYNDEEDYVEQPPMPPKPRRRPTTESEAEYMQRVQEWEAKKPHQVEVKVKGNAMTQKYYVDRLLPVYCQAVKDQAKRMPGEWYLQEDGDPSHGMQKEGLASSYKKKHGIKNLMHPAQSPDLNPIEACWNIIKQRLQRRLFHSEEDVKAAIQDEWDKITIKEIQDRIKDMPGRCTRVKNNGGKPIKTAKW